MHDSDWRGAEEGLRRTVAINSNGASSHSALCILLIVLGKAEEGLRECRVAQRLDPFDDDSALGLYFGRDYDGSIAMLRTLLQKDPNIGVWHWDLFLDYAMKGMDKEAIQEWEFCYSLYGFPHAAAKHTTCPRGFGLPRSNSAVGQGNGAPEDDASGVLAGESRGGLRDLGRQRPRVLLAGTGLPALRNGQL